MGARASIIQSDSNYCFLCGKWHPTERHHALHGSANRTLADEDGLTVMLCQECHRALHDKGKGDLTVMRTAQKAWMDYYEKSAADFIKRYGKSFI